VPRTTRTNWAWQGAFRINARALCVWGGGGDCGRLQRQLGFEALASFCAMSTWMKTWIFLCVFMSSCAFAGACTPAQVSERGPSRGRGCCLDRNIAGVDAIYAFVCPPSGAVGSPLRRRRVTQARGFLSTRDRPRPGLSVCGLPGACTCVHVLILPCLGRSSP
jgi:hypothetical protein